MHSWKVGRAHLFHRHCLGQDVLFPMDLRIQSGEKLRISQERLSKCPAVLAKGEKLLYCEQNDDANV